MRAPRGGLLALTLAACPAPEPARRPAPPDPLALLAARCDRGDGPACVEVAAAHREAGDPGRAAAYARRACDLASARGCADLAEALERGEGVPRDPARALDLSVSACLGGLVASCHAVADRIGDPAAALEFRRRACAGGGSPAEAARCPSAAPVDVAPAIDPRDAAAVVLGLSGRRAALRRCYEEALVRRPGLRGPVALEVALDGAGLARAVAVREGLREAPEVGACVAAVAASTTYAPSVGGGIVVVPWRVVFEPAP